MNFDKDTSDLPLVDKDGNAITEDNPLTLGDVLVRLVEITDPVLAGVGMDGVLDSPADSALNWALLGLFLRDIFLDQRIQALIDADVDVAAATTSTAGIVELLTQEESRLGIDTTRVPTIALILDFLRNASVTQADRNNRGTVKRADQNLGEAAVDDETYMSPRQVRHARRHQNAQATETWRGTAKRASTTQATEATDDEVMMTPAKTEDYFDNRVQKVTQAAFNALTTQQKTGKIFFIVD